MSKDRAEKRSQDLAELKRHHCTVGCRGHVLGEQLLNAVLDGPFRTFHQISRPFHPISISNKPPFVGARRPKHPVFVRYAKLVHKSTQRVPSDDLVVLNAYALVGPLEHVHGYVLVQVQASPAARADDF